MANICENELRVANATAETIKKIRNFFMEWEMVDEDTDDVSEGNYTVRFDSKWSFPEEKMDALHNFIKGDTGLYEDYPIEMICLSVEWGCTYCAFYTWDKDTGWSIAQLIDDEPLLDIGCSLMQEHLHYGRTGEPSLLV